MATEDPQLTEVAGLAEELAAQASAVIRDRFGTAMATRYKGTGGADPVTELDVAIEQDVRRRVAGAFPGHAVVGEEAPDSGGGAEWTWVVDPVDGTRNFVLGIPVLACSIGVLRRGRPVAAAVALPMSGVLVTAALGRGTRWNGAPTGVSNRLVDDGSIGAYGHDAYLSLGVDSADPARLGESRWFGSTAWELAMIAGGRLDHGVFPSTAVWDVAAGLLLVTEAGGRVLHLDDGAWSVFEAFTASPLRAWSAPLVCGGASAAQVAARLAHPPAGR